MDQIQDTRIVGLGGLAAVHLSIDCICVVVYGGNIIFRYFRDVNNGFSVDRNRSFVFTDDLSQSYKLLRERLLSVRERRVLHLTLRIHSHV